MPNWCENKITILGPEDKLRAIWDQVQKGQGLLQALVPPPENMFRGNLGPEEMKMCEEQDIPNWYDWQCENWGTKWDVDLEHLSLSEDGTQISGWFDSAWSPPTAAYKTFSLQNKDCSISACYIETGMQFVGHWDSYGLDDSYNYSEYSPTTIRDYIPESLIDDFDLENMISDAYDDEYWDPKDILLEDTSSWDDSEHEV